MRSNRLEHMGVQFISPDTFLLPSSISLDVQLARPDSFNLSDPPARGGKARNRFIPTLTISQIPEKGACAQAQIPRSPSSPHPAGLCPEITPWRQHYRNRKYSRASVAPHGEGFLISPGPIVSDSWFLMFTTRLRTRRLSVPTCPVYPVPVRSRR